MIALCIGTSSKRTYTYVWRFTCYMASMMAWTLATWGHGNRWLHPDSISYTHTHSITILTLLGLELDSSQQYIRLPPDKFAGLLTKLQVWYQHSRFTKRDLLSLIGKLSFAGSPSADQLFLRCLISLSTTIRNLHHHLYLGVQACADLAWWSDFLPMWNGTAHFIASDSVVAPDLYTDTSSVDRTSRTAGSITSGNHTSSASLSSGRNCSPSWQLLSHGATSGLASATDSWAIIKPSSQVCPAPHLAHSAPPPLPTFSPVQLHRILSALQLAWPHQLHCRYFVLPAVYMLFALVPQAT